MVKQMGLAIALVGTALALPPLAAPARADDISLKTYSCATLLQDFEQKKNDKVGIVIVLAVGSDLALSKPNEMTITDELVRKISDEVTHYCVLSFNRNKTLVNIVSELGKALSK